MSETEPIKKDCPLCGLTEGRLTIDQILPQWVPLKDHFPKHGMTVLVGNVNNRDPDNPNLGEKWRVATYLDSDQELNVFQGAVMQCKMNHVKRFVMHDSGGIESRPVEAFTHWWPIPKPFGQ